MSAAGCGDSFGVVNAEGPAADIDFVRAVVQGFAGAVISEPVPVIRMNVVFVGLAWGWTLPEFPIQVCRDGDFFAGTDRFSYVAVPGFGEVRTAYRALA